MVCAKQTSKSFFYLVFFCLYIICFLTVCLFFVVVAAVAHIKNIKENGKNLYNTAGESIY